MKTKWFIISIIALSLGCTRGTEPNMNFIDGEFTLYATSGENKTKTVLQQDGNVFWGPEDCIKVFYGNYQGKFTSTNTEPAASAEFTGTLGSFVLDGETDFLAVYPYSDDTVLGSDKSIISVFLPDEQTAVEGTFADELYISVAKSKDVNLHFYNVCGGVMFSLSRDDIKKVVFKGNNGEILAGGMAVEFNSDGIPVVTDFNVGRKSVILTAPEGETLKKGSWYYLVSAPQSLTKGYTMELYTDELVETITSDSPVTIRRSAWGVLKNLSPVTPSYLDGQIVLERKYLVKNTVGPYSYQGGTHFLGPDATIRSEKGNILQVVYWNDDYMHRYGIYLVYTDSSGDEKQECISPVKYDEWVAEKIIVASDGTVQYFMDGSLLFDRQLDIPLLSSSQTVYAIFGPYGWWYTHYHYMDDFSLKTPEAQISDNFNDGVIDLNIWEQPANPDGVFEEDGYLQMVQKRTDQDFSIKSKPIPLGPVTPTPDVPAGAVDLGLPSGLMWASCNLGASAPEEYGDYYAWGETEPNKNDYSWETYIWCKGSESSLTKYNYNDGKSSLEQADDAAYVRLGGKWRMPTKSEWQELINNCSWETTTSNGVNGVLATSKITGASIFFPYSGQKNGNEMIKTGASGYYWTSTLSPFASSACLGALSPNAGDVYLDRYIGISIRPVYGDATTNTEYGSYEAIDLGLTSGLKWASCNVGANAPEEYGDYFAWGETEPYYSSQDPLTWKSGKSAGYDWASYQWCNGSRYTMTKYCTDSSYGTVDNNTVLDPEDDAAAVNWGGTWRMPTDDEWSELYNCTWTWTTQNGVNGRLVTGPNGNSIFLPAAGYRYDTGLGDAGSLGRYWSSSLSTDFPDLAGYVIFNSDGVYRDYGGRYYGRSVRPVSE